MSRKWRNILIGIAITLVAGELLLRSSLRSKALVEVVNNGTAPIENLRIICAGEETRVPKIEPGKRGTAYISARSKAILKLTFHQANSVLSLIQFDDFNAPELEGNREKYVVEMANDGCRTTTEETGESEGNLADRAFSNIKRWLAALP